MLTFEQEIWQPWKPVRPEVTVREFNHDNLTTVWAHGDLEGRRYAAFEPARGLGAHGREHDDYLIL